MARMILLYGSGCVCVMAVEVVEGFGHYADK